MFQLLFFFHVLTIKQMLRNAYRQKQRPKSYITYIANIWAFEQMYITSLIIDNCCKAKVDFVLKLSNVN